MPSPGYDAEGEVRLVLEHRVRRRDGDVGRSTYSEWTVAGPLTAAMTGHRNIEQICKELFCPRDRILS